jgi:uncharacterized protein YjbI with pentapeptide repeats
METNSNIPVEKKVVSVEILHLDELGYGPQGKHTRQEWRAESLGNLLAGKSIFEAWQNNLISLIDPSLPNKSFAAKLIYSNVDIHTVLSDFQIRPAYTFDFVGCIFKKDARFADYSFQQLTLFTGAIFSGSASFYNAIFNKAVDFSYTNFNWYTYFSNAVFKESVKFESTIFHAKVELGGAVFSRDASLHKVRFKGDAGLQKVVFNGAADFKASVFISDVDFKNIIFNNLADFRGSIFCWFTYFENAEFKGVADFRNTTFKTGDFTKANFDENALFGSVVFTGTVKFYLAKFNKICRFNNDPIFDSLPETYFWDRVNFENVEIKNIGHFERVHFEGEIPSFLGVDNAKTRLEFSGDEYFNINDISENVVKNLGQLKRLSDEQGQTDQALMFNKFELNAKRSQAKIKTDSLTFFKKLSSSNFWFINATYLYNKLSDYGRSFTRPLVAYSCIFLITYFLAIFFAANSSPIKCSEQMFQYNGDIQSDSPVSCLSYSIPQTDPSKDDLKLTGYRAAFEYAAYRASGIFDFSDNGKATDVVTKRVFGTAIEPWWMRVWGIFKSFASIALLFLAALGLRNKYRIK